MWGRREVGTEYLSHTDRSGKSTQALLHDYFKFAHYWKKILVWVVGTHHVASLVSGLFPKKKNVTSTQRFEKGFLFESGQQNFLPRLAFDHCKILQTSILGKNFDPVKREWSGLQDRAV